MGAGATSARLLRPAAPPPRPPPPRPTAPSPPTPPPRPTHAHSPCSYNIWHTWGEGLMSVFQTLREQGYLPLVQVDGKGNMR